MFDPGQPKACFQGRDLPREGGGKQAQSREDRLGDLCLAVGNVGDALAYFMAALAGLPEEDAEVRLGIALKISACHRRQGRSEEALAFLEGLAPALGGRQRRDLLAEKATLLCLVGKYGEAAKVCEEVQHGESTSERGKDAGVYLVLGHVLSRLCRWREAVVCLEQAATFARMCGDLSGLGNALNNLGIVHKNLCKFEDARRCLVRAVRVARRAQDDASLAVRLLNLATALLKQGNVAAADLAASECLEISSRLNLARTKALATICRARLEEAKGNLASARDMLVQVLADAERIDEPRVALLARETLGDVLRRSGEAQQARVVLEGCFGDIGPESKDLECEVRSRLAEAYLALGMRGRARRAACEAMRTARAIGDLYEAARCMRIAGVASQDRADGLRYLGKAERAFAAMGAGLELGRTVFARATLEGTPAAAAIVDLKRAASIFEASSAAERLVRSLCALARARLAAGEPQRALEHMREAGGLLATSAHLGKLVSQTRAEIDVHVSEQLAQPIRERVASCEAAFSMLRARYNASVLIVGRTVGQEAEVVKVFGVEVGMAGRLVKAFAASDRNPMVSTDIGALLPDVARSSSLSALVGFRLDDAEPGAVCLVCWQGRRQPRGSVGSEISYLVGAFHEISMLSPVLGMAIAPKRRAAVPMCLGGLLTADPGVKAMLVSLPRIAATRTSVLVTGETGTGKELVAQAIHMLSPRRQHPLVVQNCAALPEQLLESELFGHRAGAFTDARADKRGLLETASGGTFFLDEIGDVAPAIQAKMLRAIESGQIRRLGDTQVRPIDVRFVAATNKDLEHEVERGRFRRDLYYRLNVVSLALSPLRERRDDILLLAKFFLARCAASAGRPAVELDDSAHRALTAYAWPGNVRQLENEIERAVAMMGRRNVLTAGMLSPRVTGGGGAVFPSTLKDEVRAVERARILSVLEMCSWNKTHAARALGGVSRPALLSKMKRLGIPAANPRKPQAEPCASGGLEA